MNTTAMIVTGSLFGAFAVYKYVSIRNDKRLLEQENARLRKDSRTVDSLKIENSSIKNKYQGSMRVIEELKREIKTLNVRLSMRDNATGGSATRSEKKAARNSMEQLNKQVGKKKSSSYRSRGNSGLRSTYHDDTCLTDTVVAATLFADSTPSEPVVRDSSPSYCSGGSSDYGSSSSSSYDSGSSSCCSSSSCD